MPKKSKNSKDKQHMQRSKSVWLLRFIPIDILLVALSLMLSLHIRWWPFEFIASYTPQILIFLATYFMIYATFVAWYLFVDGFDGLLKKTGKVAGSMLVAGTLITIYTLAYSLNVVTPLNISSELEYSPDHLTVGTFNKLYRSEDFSFDAGLIVGEIADVYALQEVSESDVEYLQSRVNHQYSYITDCNCSAEDTEVAVISRYPIINAQTVYEADNAAIVRTLISSEKFGEFVVYAVHNHVPYVVDEYAKRGQAFELLSNSIDSETLPTFAMGDFNTTVFSPDMQKFMKETERAKNVVQRAWPRCSWFGTPFNELACARIDYVFAPVGSRVYSVEVGSQDFSDHRSVTVELVF